MKETKCPVCMVEALSNWTATYEGDPQDEDFDRICGMIDELQGEMMVSIPSKCFCEMHQEDYEEMFGSKKQEVQGENSYQARN